MKRPITDKQIEEKNEKTKEKRNRNKELEKHYRSKYFQEVRQMVFERDGHRCRCCCSTDKERILNVHHSKYDGVLYEEKEHLEYLITLCSVCHRAIHSSKANWKKFKKNQ